MKTEHSVTFLVRWFCLVFPLALIVGTTVALFLWLLDVATNWRFAAPILLLLLPAAGVWLVWLYREHGGESGKGNNLILEHIHEPGAGRIPQRMAPLVLISTVVTHLFGGSAGREGTAVQMGGSIASRLTEYFQLSSEDRSLYLMCGVAAGFGAVFGTPLAGAIFAVEVITVGRIRYRALVPCLMASILADQVCLFWKIEHTQFSLPLFQDLAGQSGLVWGWAMMAAIAGIAFGGAARLFVVMLHGLEKLFNHSIEFWWQRPVIGAVLVLGISLLLGSTDYLGLGIQASTPEGISILSSFEGQVGALSWFWKLLLTAITLSCGFRGGEVTPLFFIGATLGAALANLFGLPSDLFAAIGFVAVFSGATKTPLACTIMGAELFGAEAIVYLAIGCFIAVSMSGARGIYASQRRDDEPDKANSAN